MKSYSEKKYCKTEYNFSKSNDIFRNFLVRENADHYDKIYQTKRREILPDYTSIKNKIRNRVKEIKSYYDIKGTIFKEIQSNDTMLYDKFKKDVTLFFFGPKGTITQQHRKLKKYYAMKNKNKIGLNTKIYAGRWEFFENSNTQSRYMDRLKNAKKKILQIGGNFSTEDSLVDRIHHFVSKIKAKEKKEDENLVIDKKILQKKLRRFSVVNKTTPMKSFQKSFFETSIEPSQKKNINDDINNISLLRSNFKRGTTINTIPSILRGNTHKNKLKKIPDLKKINNIFKKQKILERIKKEKNQHLKKINDKINLKLISIIGNNKVLNDNMDLIKKKNELNYTDENRKEKFKIDAKVIAEDDRKDNYNNMSKFMEVNSIKQRKKDIKAAPSKIYFSYYDQSRNYIHKSVKEFVRNIWKNKEEERERKYYKNVRKKFKENREYIIQLGMNLDNLINSKKKLK
jgi:hypothetical protein